LLANESPILRNQFLTKNVVTTNYLHYSRYNWSHFAVAMGSKTSDAKSLVALHCVNDSSLQETYLFWFA